MLTSITNDQQISVDSYNGLELFHINEIIFFEIENGIVYIKLSSYQRVPVKNTLKDLENRLRIYAFYRIHARHLVNFLYVRKYIHKTGDLTMADDVVLTVAKDRKSAFKSKVESLFGKTALL